MVEMACMAPPLAPRWSPMKKMVERITRNTDTSEMHMKAFLKLKFSFLATIPATRPKRKFRRKSQRMAVRIKGCHPSFEGWHPFIVPGT